MDMYDRIRNDVSSRDLPIGCASANGEFLIIEKGKDDAGAYYRIKALQDNGWCRISTYYACGDATETYIKSEKRAEHQ